MQHVLSQWCWNLLEDDVLRDAVPAFAEIIRDPSCLGVHFSIQFYVLGVLSVCERDPDWQTGPDLKIG